MMRPVRTAILAALAAALLTPGPALAKDKDEAPPVPSKPIRVAVLPLMNTTAEVLANQTVHEALQEQLKALSGGAATFILPEDTDRILNSQNAYDRGFRIAEKWSKYAKLDSSAIQGLDSVLVADAVLCVKISEWEINRVQQMGAGPSTTTVGLSFALYDIRSKNLIWKKDVREQRQAPEYDPSSGQISYDGTGTIQTRSANEPPRPKSVAGDLIKAAFKKFPRS